MRVRNPLIVSVAGLCFGGAIAATAWSQETRGDYETDQAAPTERDTDDTLPPPKIPPPPDQEAADQPPATEREPAPESEPRTSEPAPESEPRTSEPATPEPRRSVPPRDDAERDVRPRSPAPDRGAAVEAEGDLEAQGGLEAEGTAGADVEGRRMAAKTRQSVQRRFGFGLEVAGGGDLMVSTVTEGSLAARSRLHEGDIILSVNDEEFVTAEELHLFLLEHAHERVTLIVLRDGREMTLVLAPPRRGVVAEPAQPVVPGPPLVPVQPGFGPPVIKPVPVPGRPLPPRVIEGEIEIDDGDVEIEDVEVRDPRIIDPQIIDPQIIDPQVDDVEIEVDD